MEIGGTDLIYKTNGLIHSKALSFEIMQYIGWEHAVFEEAGGDDFFWYVDLEAKEEWDEDVGPDNTMIYFLLGEDTLSVVSDADIISIIKKAFDRV